MTHINNNEKPVEMRNALSDAIMIWQKQMLPREFTQHFISEVYNPDQIETMLTHTPVDFAKNEKLIPALTQDEEGKNYLNIYLDNQRIINMVVLTGLFDVAYEKHQDATGNILNEPRVSFINSRDPMTKRIQEYPKPAIDALRLISTANYEVTLPKFAMWYVYNPHQDLTTMTRQEIANRMFSGFNPAKWDYGTSDLIIQGRKVDMKHAEEIYKEMIKKELGATKEKNFQSGTSALDAASQLSKSSKTNFGLLSQKYTHNK